MWFVVTSHFTQSEVECEMAGHEPRLEPPFLVYILYDLCQVVTSLTWGMYCLYGTPAQCDWVMSNCFFISLIIWIAWRPWCGCDESPCIIYQGDVSKGFNDMIWTDVGNMWETLYMIVLVIELNIARAEKYLEFFEESIIERGVIEGPMASLCT